MEAGPASAKCATQAHLLSSRSVRKSGQLFHHVNQCRKKLVSAYTLAGQELGPGSWSLLSHINQTASTSTITCVRGILCSAAWMSIDLRVELSFSRLADFKTK